MNALKRVSLSLLVVSLLGLTGCASTPRNADDPLESFNRAMFSFNEGVDKVVVKPASQVYETVTPGFVRTGVGNFFGNLGDVWIGFNNMLQGKVGDGLSDWMRFMVNSTFGFAGVLDIASEMGLEKNNEDFGQTLAVWGVGEGPYVVLPLLGSRTLRDTAALPVDWKGDPVAYMNHDQSRMSVTALRVVHVRASLLGAEKLIEDSLDKYSVVRDSYLQRRRFLVHDGNPPVDYEDFDEQSSLMPVRTMADALVETAVGKLELATLASVNSDQNRLTQW